VSQVPDILRGLVRERARNRCEYCLIAEAFVTRHETYLLARPLAFGLLSLLASLILVA